MLEEISDWVSYATPRPPLAAAIAMTSHVAEERSATCQVAMHHDAGRCCHRHII